MVGVEAAGAMVLDVKVEVVAKAGLWGHQGGEAWEYRSHNLRPSNRPTESNAECGS
jgi:hypothetical protein